MNEMDIIIQTNEKLKAFIETYISVRRYFLLGMRGVVRPLHSKHGGYEEHSIERKKRGTNHTGAAN